MAPSAGLHKLVVRNVKLSKAFWKKISNLIERRLSQNLRPASNLQLIPVRVNAQPSHPVAALRQSKGRWYTTHSTINAAVRRFTTSADIAAQSSKYNRSLFPKSQAAIAISRLPGRAPFASALRPNLTGGALGRTSGGYSLGSGRIGGARYFSHTPSASAHVIQNVSQAVRAFCLSGQKAQFAGIDPHTGEKRFRAVSTLQDKTLRKVSSLPKATPGSYIDFAVNPSITALTPLSAVAGYSFSESTKEETTLNTLGLLNVLSVDFSRSLKDLAAVLNDLNRLAALGDLPITYRSSAALRVHFPGCDAETVEKLCQEIGVQRGVISQDDDFDAFVGSEIALLFPFAPDASEIGEDPFHSLTSADYVKRDLDPIDWRNMMSPAVSQYDDHLSVRSEDSALEPFEEVDGGLNPWTSSVEIESPEEGYESMSPGSWGSPVQEVDGVSPLEYQDFEGIRRFIELCEPGRR